VPITAAAGPPTADQRQRSQSGEAIVPTVVARAIATAPKHSAESRLICAAAHDRNRQEGEASSGMPVTGRRGFETVWSDRPDWPCLTYSGTNDAMENARSSFASSVASVGRVGLAGASRAATTVRAVADCRGPVVTADAASPPCFQARSCSERGGVDIGVARGVKFGDELGPPGSERSLLRDGSRSAFPLAATSASRAAVPGGPRGHQRLPFMPA
jgi:hypothetical protein